MGENIQSSTTKKAGVNEYIARNLQIRKRVCKETLNIFQGVEGKNLITPLLPNVKRTFDTQTLVIYVAYI